MGYWVSLSETPFSVGPVNFAVTDCRRPRVVNERLEGSLRTEFQRAVDEGLLRRATNVEVALRRVVQPEETPMAEPPDDVVEREAPAPMPHQAALELHCDAEVVEFVVEPKPKTTGRRRRGSQSRRTRPN